MTNLSDLRNNPPVFRATVLDIGGNETEVDYHDEGQVALEDKNGVVMLRIDTLDQSFWFVVANLMSWSLDRIEVPKPVTLPSTPSKAPRTLADDLEAMIG